MNWLENLSIFKGNSSKKEIQQLQRRFFWRFFLKEMLLFLIFWGFGWGLFVLLMRMLFHLSSTTLQLLSWHLPLLFLLPLQRALRQIPSDSQCHALLDRKNHLGGIFLASYEVNIDPWAEHLNLRPLSIRWNVESKYLWTLLASFLFLWLAFAIPHRYFKNEPPQPLDIHDQVVKIRKNIDRLKKAHLIDERRAKKLKKELLNIEKKSLGREPSRTWNALEQLSRKNKEIAQKSLAQAIQKMEKTITAQKKLQQLLNQIRKTRKKKKMTPLKKAIFRKKMKKLLRKMASSSQADKKSGEKQIRHSSSFQNVSDKDIEKFTSQDLQKLFSEKTQRYARQLRTFQQLAHQRLLDKKLLNKAQKLLRQFSLKRSSSSKKNLSHRPFPRRSKALQSPSRSGKKGRNNSFHRGGKGKATDPKITTITTNKKNIGAGKSLRQSGQKGGTGEFRGRPAESDVSAAMTWRRAPSLAGVKFRPHILPRSKLLDLKRSHLIGMSLVPMKDGVKESLVRSGFLKARKKGHSSARTHRIYPRYLKSIKRYFHSSNSSQMTK